jgi:hypothetical protein
MESKRFAWLPCQMTSGAWVWFRYYCHHRNLYDETTGRPPINSYAFEWTETVQEKTLRLLKQSIRHNRNIWNTPDLTQQDET